MQLIKYIPKVNVAFGLSFLSMNVFQSRAMYFTQETWLNMQFKFNIFFCLYFILTIWKTLSASTLEANKVLQTEQMFSIKTIKLFIYFKKIIWLSMGISSLVFLFQGIFFK